MTIIDKPKKKKVLQWCNLTLNDKGLGILGTHVKNILETQISYLCNVCRCLQLSHNAQIGEEHKAHAMQVNNKNDNYK